MSPFSSVYHSTTRVLLEYVHRCFMLLIFFFLSLLRASSTLKFGSPLHCSTLRWQQQITCNRCLSGQCVASSLRCISISLYLKISGGCSWASEPRWPGGQWPVASSPGECSGGGSQERSGHLPPPGESGDTGEVQVHKALCDLYTLNRWSIPTMAQRNFHSMR